MPELPLLFLLPGNTAVMVILFAIPVISVTRQLAAGVEKLPTKEDSGSDQSQLLYCFVQVVLLPAPTNAY